MNCTWNCTGSLVALEQFYWCHILSSSTIMIYGLSAQVEIIVKYSKFDDSSDEKHIPFFLKGATTASHSD